MKLDIKYLGRPVEGAKKSRIPHGYRVWPGHLIAVLVLFGPGCTTKPPIVTQEVKIPVAVPCITAAPARPAFEFPLLSPTATNGDKILTMARDTLLHFKYEGQLEAAIAGCL